MLKELKTQMNLMNYYEFDEEMDKKIDKIENYLIEY